MILLLINGRKRMEVTRNHSWNGFQFDQAAAAIRQQSHNRTSSAPSTFSHQTSGLGGTTMPSSSSSSSSAPSSEWVQCYDENTGYSFFQNTRTGESQWIEPEDWAQEEQSWKEDMQQHTNSSSTGETKLNSDIQDSSQKDATIGKKTSNVVTEMRTAVQVRHATCLLFLEIVCFRLGFHVCLSIVYDQPSQTKPNQIRGCGTNN
mgnify:CR=1 FL=1